MLKRLVLDVEKGYNPPIIDLAIALSRLDGVYGSNIVLYEMDRGVMNIKIVIEGSDINYDSVDKKIREYHGVIRSVDEATSSKRE